MDYSSSCINATIAVKTMKKYPDFKPWITAQMKHSLKEQYKVLGLKDWAGLRTANRNQKLGS